MPPISKMSADENSCLKYGEGKDESGSFLLA